MLSKNFIKMLETPVTSKDLESPAGRKASKLGKESFNKMYLEDGPSYRF